MTFAGVHNAELQRLLLERKATQAAHAVHQAELLASQAKAEYDQYIAMEHITERVAHSQTKRKLAEAEAALLAVQPKEAKKPKLTAMTRPLTAFGVTVARTKKGGEEVDVTSELIHSERKAMEGLRYHCDNANCDAAFETPKQLANHRRVHNQESK
jgi:hypothetical protein